MSINKTKTNEFFYELPEELIAQKPLKERDKSRLLILDKTSGETKHTNFYKIKDFLREGDCLVINDTKVLPARLFGRKRNTGALIEFLLLKRIDKNTWETMVKPGKKAKPGTEIIFKENILEGKIIESLEGGTRLIEFNYKGVFEEILDELGEMPLPPYIHEKLQNKNRYQTVYAKQEGSAAAPTAGLHFNEELLRELEKKGIVIARITLHVGLGTFRPVKDEYIEEHKMHSEYFEISKDTVDKINKAKKDNNRIIAVGTTTTRTLETVGQLFGEIKEYKGWTDIFIYPGYEFRIIDALITNFHLPESTLIMLVSAFAGKNNTMKAYKEAVDLEYRFFSFGDAMFIK